MNECFSKRLASYGAMSLAVAAAGATAKADVIVFPGHHLTSQFAPNVFLDFSFKTGMAENIYQTATTRASFRLQATTNASQVSSAGAVALVPGAGFAVGADGYKILRLRRDTVVGPSDGFLPGEVLGGYCLVCNPSKTGPLVNRGYWRRNNRCCNF